MQLTPEIKAQLTEQKKNCIFCKIIAKEVPGHIVYEDSKAIAMLDIRPALKGHTLLMTTEHYPIMPYIPADEFSHLFGIVPELAKVLQKSLVRVGTSLFIANGGAAGQQAPHFMIHLFAREAGDQFNNFVLKQNQENVDEKAAKMLAHNFPIMIANHFKRNPAAWHTGTGQRPERLSTLEQEGTVVYEDEKGVVILPQKSHVKGELIVYPKAEAKDLTNLTTEDSAHLFYLASFAATALFEGLGAHATNIIVNSLPYENKRLAIHVLARYQGDGNDSFLWQGREADQQELASTAKEIKEDAWKITEALKGSKKLSQKVETKAIPVLRMTKGPQNSKEEIAKAIELLRKN